MQPHPITAALVTAMLTALPAAQAPSSSGAAANRVLPFKASETTLANGLKVIIVPTGFPNLVSIQVVVQTGSRNEVEAGKSGFAHFFEHLMFRGTPTYPSDRYQAIMKRAGARDNAGTGDDSTHYYATFAKDDLDDILALYADMFQNLSYPEAAFKTEARAILGEYNKNSAEPLQKLFEVQRDRFYRAHTYKHTTMGFIQDIENMPNEYAYSKVFFERWYRPQYTTLIVAGDVAPEGAMPKIEKLWGPWKSGGSGSVTIPKEPPPTGPRYAHVPWPSDTLPFVTVAFPSPAFDEHGKDAAAMEILGSVYFGPTSDLYKKLVVRDQKVDQLQVDDSVGLDPSLMTVMARLKNPSDAIDVRDQIVATFAAARETELPAARLAEAKSFRRYSFARGIDSTERIAAAVAAYAPFRRSYETINNYFATLDSLTPADVLAAARRFFTNEGLMVTTLSHGSLPAGIERAPALSATKAASGPAASGDVPLIQQKSLLPQLDVKLLFAVGSAHDPAGKEGLTALTASMLSRAGSKSKTIDEIDATLYPTAGSFASRTDKEMTAMTGLIHRDQWRVFADVALPQLVDPGWRPEDFERLKTRQMNALVQDLRSNNEEELGKERLQTNLFRGTPYGHVALGTVAGLRAITLEDVKAYAREMFTRANLTVGVSGDAPDGLIADLQTRLQALPAGSPALHVRVNAPRPSAPSVEILEKDTRATAISFGFPIDVTRSHADFAALSVARSWLGEHRLSSGRLYDRIREVRGMNYGDYAYIEAFPRGMFQFFPDPNVVRSRQIFEIWIRPVVPANAHMALRIAMYEFGRMVQNGLSKADFEATRDYLMKNVYVMTARQDQQLGYALDSRWYGIGEFTEHMRAALRALTVDAVNQAIVRHLGGQSPSIVIVTKDAASLRQALASDAVSTIRYDGEKPKALLAEDQVVGALKLNIPAANITITPIEKVFAE